MHFFFPFCFKEVLYSVDPNRKALMPRKERKERLGQRRKDGEDSLCSREGKKREARKERIARKG